MREQVKRGPLSGSHPTRPSRGETAVKDATLILMLMESSRDILARIGTQNRRGNALERAGRAKRRWLFRIAGRYSQSGVVLCVPRTPYSHRAICRSWNSAPFISAHQDL